MIKTRMTIWFLLAAIIFLGWPVNPSQAGLFDVVETIAESLGVLTGGISSLVTTLGKFMVDAGVEILKKRMLDAIVDQIIVSIEGGEQPLFIQDWRSFLLQYANVATGDIVQALGLGAVCRPFGIQLQLAVLQPPLFSNQITCTLDQIVGNVTNFYEDFRRGGFIAYRELWQPRNNFYGALLIAMNEEEERVAAELFAATQEATAGSGYLGTRKCVQGQGGRFCFIQTPGVQVGAMLAKAYGSKIDWLVETKDFAGYTAAVADALINRMLKEGVFALKSYAENLPSSEEIYARYVGEQPALEEQRCAGLTGSLQEQCLTDQALRGNEFAATRRALLGQLNATLNPLLTAENTTRQSIDRQQNLINALTQLRDCQINRGVAGKEETIAELQNEEPLLTELRADLVEINQFTTPLLNVRAHLQNPPSQTTFTLVSIFSEIELLLNSEQAQQVRAEVQNKFNSLKTKVDQRLPAAQQQLDRCARS